MVSRPNSLTLPVVGKGTLTKVRKAISRFDLLRPFERVAIAFSGGKDSLFLISALQELSNDPTLNYRLHILHLDQQQPGYEKQRLQELISAAGIEYTILSEDTYSIVQQQKKPGQISCSICSRLRRGILNAWCARHGFDKLAIGHHFDDAIETFFLNLFFGRRLEELKARTPQQEGMVAAVRPLILLSEEAIKTWVREYELSPLPCPVCDFEENSMRRQAKDIITRLSADYPNLRASVLQALYGQKKEK